MEVSPSPSARWTSGGHFSDGVEVLRGAVVVSKVKKRKGQSNKPQV
jgi:hypothetical protein